jgi:SAM-dependent methyltransferase
MRVSDNVAYKTSDHLFRSTDEYAQGKYDVTTRWLAPRIQLGQRLLNIGCGGGEYNAKAHSLGLSVIACEPEANAFELALRNAPAGVDVLPCGLMELAERVPPADFIVMHDVLEHIADDVAAVAAVRNLLVPGGTAVISVPAYQWLFGHHDVQLGHYRRYKRSSLVALFRDGFEIEAARYYGAALIPVALWYSRIAKKGYPVATASRGLAHAGMRLVCQLESRLPMPVGTSVLLRVRRV